MSDLTQKYIVECVNYDELSGKLVWKSRPVTHFKSASICKWWNSRYSGKTIGYKRKDGYMEFAIGGKLYLLHRVIWLYKTGRLPVQVDHIDHVRSNNRWENLREVTAQENRCNMSRPKDNHSGTIGISWSKISGKWHSYITIFGKRKHLGLFDDINDAISARKDAELELGFHENHGSSNV